MKNNLSMNTNDFNVPAGDFLVMVSRWAFNTNLTNGLWVEKIWAERPDMASFLAGEYRQKLAETSEETQPYYALVNFISNLDDTNRVIFAKAIYDYATNAFGFEFNR